jgi:hypothetical protein
VFVKVFDESRGYYGNQGHVARFERDLDERGQYGAFKEAFRRIAGIPWTQGREQTALEGPSIDRAFAEVNGGAAEGIIKQYSASYAVSIEDFADEVKSWLDKQDDPNFRLNFFVDEVGQFIGSDAKLMLDLQTIAESLNTKCAGRSWMFVTSQEDMEKVIGDRTRQQGNDFSKIQARFKTRLKLSSANVDEVIRKRLLEKNDAGTAVLGNIYADQDAVRLRRRVQDLPQLRRRGSLHRDLPVRQLPVLAVPGRYRGHLGPQCLRGPQQLGRRAVHARGVPAGRQGHCQRRGGPPCGVRPYVRRYPGLAEGRRSAFNS